MSKLGILVVIEAPTVCVSSFLFILPSDELEVRDRGPGVEAYSHAFIPPPSDFALSSLSFSGFHGFGFGCLFWGVCDLDGLCLRASDDVCVGNIGQLPWHLASSRGSLRDVVL